MEDDDGGSTTESEYYYDEEEAHDVNQVIKEDTQGEEVPNVSLVGSGSDVEIGSTASGIYSTSRTLSCSQSPSVSSTQPITISPRSLTTTSQSSSSSLVRCPNCDAVLAHEPRAQRRVSRVMCKCCSRWLRKSLSFTPSELRLENERRCRSCVQACRFKYKQEIDESTWLWMEIRQLHKEYSELSAVRTQLWTTLKQVRDLVSRQLALVSKLPRLERRHHVLYDPARLAIERCWEECQPTSTATTEYVGYSTDLTANRERWQKTVEQEKEKICLVTEFIVAFAYFVEQCGESLPENIRNVVTKFKNEDDGSVEELVVHIASQSAVPACRPDGETKRICDGCVRLLPESAFAEAEWTSKDTACCDGCIMGLDPERLEQMERLTRDRKELKRELRVIGDALSRSPVHDAAVANEMKCFERAMFAIDFRRRLSRTRCAKAPANDSSPEMMKRDRELYEEQQ